MLKVILMLISKGYQSRAADESNQAGCQQKQKQSLFRGWERFTGCQTHASLEAKENTKKSNKKPPEPTPKGMSSGGQAFDRSYWYLAASFCKAARAPGD